MPKTSESHEDGTQHEDAQANEPTESHRESESKKEEKGERTRFADAGITATEAPDKGEAVSDFFALVEVFHRVVATAHEELSRHNRLLFWSAVAGGLVLGMSLLGHVAMTLHAPGGNVLIGNLLYPIGFIILILGRYQLFTENTLTPVTLVLTRLASVRDLFRLWGVVFAGNMVGALVFAGFLGPFGVLSPEATLLAIGFGEHLTSEPWIAAFGKAILAGWLMAIIVWLVHAARETFSRVVLIWLLIYLQVTADLFHSISGAIEVQFAMFQGAVTLGSYLWDFQIPVTLGNAVGGVVFVAVLNYVQLSKEEEPGEPHERRLSFREWVLGRRSQDGG